MIPKIELFCLFLNESSDTFGHKVEIINLIINAYWFLPDIPFISLHISDLV